MIGQLAIDLWGKVLQTPKMQLPGLRCLWCCSTWALIRFSSSYLKYFISSGWKTCGNIANTSWFGTDTEKTSGTSNKVLFRGAENKDISSKSTHVNPHLKLQSIALLTWFDHLPKQIFNEISKFNRTSSRPGKKGCLFPMGITSWWSTQ